MMFNQINFRHYLRLGSLFILLATTIIVANACLGTENTDLPMVVPETETVEPPNQPENPAMIEPVNPPMDTLEVPEPELIEPSTPKKPLMVFQELQLINNSDCNNLGTTTRFPNSVVVEISLESQTQFVLAELADRSSLRTQGLMCRLNVGDGEGMLFIFDDIGPQTGNFFWMFNTYNPLDILYINADSTLNSMRTMLPCPRTSTSGDDWAKYCSTIASNNYKPKAGVPYAAAIELPAGWLARTGIDFNALSDTELANVRITWKLSSCNPGDSCF